jgi:nucleotide-binding universal stress UspA family protein
MTALGELRFNRLLISVDGSANADLALSAAVTAARRDNSALTLISVAPDARAEAARWPGALAAPQTTQEEFDATAERTLREAVERIPADIPVERIVRRGAAGPEIVAQSKVGCYDAILLGARGLGRISALVGSVSQYVLNHADIAVFVAHAPREASDAEPLPPVAGGGAAGRQG